MGYRVGTIKHDAHQFAIDQPGKDTWRHRRSGADQTVITSSTETAWISQKAVPLENIIQTLNELDLVLVEGFKQAKYAKIVMVKNDADLALANKLVGVRALAVWPEMYSLAAETPFPVYSIHNIDGILKQMVNEMEAGELTF